MLRFRLLSLSSPRIPETATSTRPSSNLRHYSSPFLKTQFRIPKSTSRFVLLAQNGNGDDLIKESGDKERKNGDDDGDFDLKKDQRAAFNFKWSDLLDPDRDNFVAVGLTGLLAWASAQVLWQLTFVSFAILIAALKYTFIAAFLLFILIALL